MTMIRRVKRARLGFAGLIGLFVTGAALEPSSGIEAQSLPPSLTYTAAQADQGRAAYVEHCASCHGEKVDDGAYAPALKGLEFRQRWGAEPAEALFTYTSTKMPPARPGSLGDQGYAQLLAYIVQENGTKPGTRELPAAPDALRAMLFPGWPRGGGGGLAPGANVPPAPARLNPLDKIRPVTDSMLTHVADGEWLAWRR